MLTNIFEIKPEYLKEQIPQEYPAYRTKQLLDWLYNKLVFDPALMTNLPPAIKDYLGSNFSFKLPEIDVKVSSADGTTKYRLKLSDGSFIECVMIPEKSKRTLCVSSQVGCKRACTFCATAKMKLQRNLAISEIIGQVLLVSKDIYPSRITNLVFMGMGEPMDNLENVAKSLAILQDNSGLSFSPRRCTISTCGIVPGILALADMNLKAKLAVSLNSAIDEKRSQIMPINSRYNLAQLKQAITYYRRKSSYRVTFEYILIPDFNMDMVDIRALAKYVNDISSKINFIPYNSAGNSSYQAPSKDQIESFMQKAQMIRQAITLRRSRGADISGACGQLAIKELL